MNQSLKNLYANEGLKGIIKDPPTSINVLQEFVHAWPLCFNNENKIVCK